MKKIGIMTFHRAHNYGSILQSLALQRYINSNPGSSCEIIDFSNTQQKEMYKIYKENDSLKYIIRNIIAFFFRKILQREYDEFEVFISANLEVSENKYTIYKDLRKNHFEYDVLVTGSDQVWNIKCIDADDVYFLNFTNLISKVAYAPSFGAKNLQVIAKDVKKYIDCLNEFKAISIREKNGQKWLKELLGIDVPLLIDPTLFYDKEYWNELACEDLIKGKFILYYSFHFSQEINKAVHKIRKKLKLPVVILSPKAFVFSAGMLYGFKLSPHSGPDAFLSLVQKSELVISNSYHGTVFSVVFEKKFWFLYGSVQDQDDDRASTLVEQLGIEKRVLRLKDIDNVDLMESIDYSLVKERLINLRRYAFDFIQTNILEDEV